MPDFYYRKIDMKTKLVCLALGLAAFSAAMDLSNAATNETARVISADLRQTSGPLDTMFNFCVGAGRANEGLRADWQRQLTYAHDQCGFRYIRMHGLFDDDMGVYREERGVPQYNWQYIDELYDFLHRIGMKPFVELGFMPDALASGPKTIFWYHGNVTPPKDMNKWANFIKAFVEHERDRYGDAEVRTWYFEVWNEPNLSGFLPARSSSILISSPRRRARSKTSTPITKSVARRRRAPAGCRSSSISATQTARRWISFPRTPTACKAVTWMSPAPGTALARDPNSIIGDVKRVRQQISNSAIPKLELHFTEWSASYTPSDPIHDSYHSAAYILEKLKKCGDAAQSMSYWTFTDIFEEAGPRFEAFHGGFGLINYEDINKPSFYAYQFLNRLGPTELKDSDPESWICTDKSGGVQALVWDFTNTFPRTNMINQVFYKRDLPSEPKNKVTLNLSHLRSGKYTMTTYKVGYRVNDAYATYHDMGTPAQLTKAQVAEIKSKNSGAPLETKTVKIGRDGNFQQQFDLRDNDVVLVTLTPKR